MKLKNLDIFQAREPLQQLMGVKLPVRVSFQVATLASKLNDKLKVIEEVRNGLVNSYGEKDEHGRVSVKEGSDNFPKFASEFNELMEQEVELSFEKVKLPEKVASTCDACHHNMDRPFEIEPSILMALEKFVEVI